VSSTPAVHLEQILKFLIVCETLRLDSKHDTVQFRYGTNSAKTESVSFDSAFHTLRFEMGKISVILYYYTSSVETERRFF
jgi:hypothetical protein